MPRAQEIFNGDQIHIVGSFGDSISLGNTTLAEARKSCDILEIRLDILVAEGLKPDASLWAHLAGFPTLFTARRKEEGSPIELSAAERSELIRNILEEAAIIDVEVASIDEMSELLDEIKQRGIPWVASYHNFEKLPSSTELAAAAKRAKNAGATVFKAAARLATPADIARLAEFQLADHGITVATMGMGPLAPVSRLLCAQSGSVLNYGFLGETATAPGQWSAGFLKQAVSQLNRNS